MRKELEKAIEDLTEKTRSRNGSIEVQQLSQAVLNLMHAYSMLIHLMNIRISPESNE